MRVRRAAAVTGLVLGLSVLGTPAWGDEPAPDPACTTYPVDEGDPGAGEGEASAEPGPVEEAPVEEPAPEGEPAPEETAEPAAEETGEPPVEPTDEPTGEPGSAAPEQPTGSDEPSPDPSAVVVCLYAAAGEAVQDSSTAGAGTGEAAEQLPRTGEPTLDLLGLGAGLVLLGAGVLAVGRRRTA